MSAQNQDPLPIPVPPPIPPVVWLDVPYREQLQDNWCWAACCQMFLEFRNTLHATMTQCQLAGRRFNKECCQTVTDDCDRGSFPEAIYDPLLVDYERHFSSMSQATIKAELLAGRPVQIQFKWISGGKHVALVSGFYVDGDLEVLDPLHGHTRCAFSEVEDAYGRGTWNKTYTDLT